jgi:hypothetical protein
MNKRTAFLAGVVTMAIFLAALGGPPSATKAFVPPGIQDFDLDLVECLVPAVPDVISPDPMLGPYLHCGTEAKGVSGSGNEAVTSSVAIGLIEGNRTGLPYIYTGPGWIQLDDASIVDGTKVGDVASALDLFQDGQVDILADSSNIPPVTLATAVPEPYYERSTAWETSAGCSGESEAFLSEAIPGAAAMQRYVRYRACIDTFFLFNGAVKYPLPVDVPLNLVFLAPNWSPTGTLVNLVLSTGAATSPTTLLAGTDTPQASISHHDAPYSDNPATPGLYVRWSTEISSADEADRTINFMYSTSCKAIGGSFTDADSDCLQADADAAAGQPSEKLDGGDAKFDCDGDDTFEYTLVGGGDPTANIDTDGDFLLDGIECAWGSDPTLADTDGDGRTDLEEMIGPTQLLSDPTLQDTDADGVLDGGLIVDADGDGVPDCLDEDGDGKGPGCAVADTDGIVSPPTHADTGISPNLDASADGSSHVRVGVKIVGKDIEADGAGMDNCPSIPNADQLNTDYDTSLAFNPNRTGLGNGDVYGDACDIDDDEDDFVDGAETNFAYIAGGCTDAPSATNLLNPLNPDSDGDCYLDGTECELGSNPADPNSTPGLQAPDDDNDGVRNDNETYQRSQNFSDQRAPRAVGSEDVDGDGLVGKDDPDSDVNGAWTALDDWCEAMVTGTSPVSTDTDNDGVLDVNEPAVPALVAACCSPADPNDRDGDGEANSSDNCPTVANPGQEDTDALIGNGCSIAGDDGTTPWDNDGGRGDACDGRGSGNFANDITYDDDGDGDWKDAPGDDGTYWDTDMDSKWDWWGTAACGSTSADADGDGLKDAWEVCKWGTDPDKTNSDGDTRGDCKEAADVNGDGVVGFVGDTIAYAKAALLPAGCGAGQYGKDGDFDINGDGVIDFVGDVIQEAKYALGVDPCL